MPEREKGEKKSEKKEKSFISRVQPRKPWEAALWMLSNTVESGDGSKVRFIRCWPDETNR